MKLLKSLNIFKKEQTSNLVCPCCTKQMLKPESRIDEINHLFVFLRCEFCSKETRWYKSLNHYIRASTLK